MHMAEVGSAERGSKREPVGRERTGSFALRSAHQARLDSPRLLLSVGLQYIIDYDGVDLVTSGRGSVGHSRFAVQEQRAWREMNLHSQSQ